MAAPRQRGSFLAGLAVQSRVIGALMMRELHTRYGRENVGYLWMVGEPMLLATVIGLLHQTSHTQYGGDIKPLPFAVLGYTIFILFRGIVNRSEGGIEANAPLLYHRMVTVFDIIVARALLEVAGIFLTFTVLMTLIVGIGYAQLPVRPLYVLGAWGFMFWYSIAHSFLITAISYENRTIGRLVHPYSYFMVGLSGAFIQIEWLPHPFREIMQWIPMTSIFELARYGQFRSGSLTYFHGMYLTGACMLITWTGLVSMGLMRNKIHL